MVLCKQWRKAPPARDESDCTRDVGEFAGGEKKVSRCDLSLPDATLARLIMPTPRNILDFHNFSGMNEAHFANNIKGAFAPFMRSLDYDFLINSTG